MKSEMVMIPVARLRPHPDNPRKDLGDLTELAASIREKGILQNLTVVKRYGEVTGEFYGDYTVIIGHRRMAAAKLAGLTELPCAIVDMTKEEQFSTMMVENIQRCDLTMMEEADGYQLMLDMGSSVEDVARKTGKSESTIRRRVKLVEFDRHHLIEAQERGGTMADYEALLKIKDPQKRDNVLRSVGTSGFARQLETAMEQQETEEFLDGVEEVLKGFTGCSAQTDQGLSRWNHSGWDLWMQFGMYDKKAPKEPTDGGEYIWVREAMWLGLFQKKVQLTEEDRRSQRRQEVVERLTGIREELDRYRDFYEKVRVKFLQDYTVKKQDEDDIVVLALSNLEAGINGRGYCGRVHPDAKTVADILECETKLEDGYRVIPDEAWAIATARSPMKVLLACWYGGLHSGIQGGYCESTYEREACVNGLKFRINHELDLAYNGLLDLGYEVGDEEYQLLRGSHPLFWEAQDLIEDYKKELGK